MRFSVAVGMMLSVLLTGCASTTTSEDDDPEANQETCDSLAKQATEIEDQDPRLIKVRNPKVKRDNQDTFELPSGDKEAVLLSCTGMGVFSSGGNQRVLLRYTVDADGDTFIAYEPIA